MVHSTVDGLNNRTLSKLNSGDPHPSKQNSTDPKLVWRKWGLAPHYPQYKVEAKMEHPTKVLYNRTFTLPPWDMTPQLCKEGNGGKEAMLLNMSPCAPTFKWRRKVFVTGRSVSSVRLFSPSTE